jgi:hypothetical protein
MSLSGVTDLQECDVVSPSVSIESVCISIDTERNEAWPSVFWRVPFFTQLGYVILQPSPTLGVSLTLQR